MLFANSDNLISSNNNKCSDNSIFTTLQDKQHSITNYKNNKLGDAYAGIRHTIQSHGFALLYELYTIRHELEEVNVDA